MKHALRMVLPLLLAGLLLLTPVATLAEATPAPLQTVAQAYLAVLGAQTPYTFCGEGVSAQQTFSRTVTEWSGYSFTDPYTYKRFCLTDLDADNLPEVILELSDAQGTPFGFTLLRYEGGVVYGFPFVYRAMEWITLEGDVFFSNGAADNGWGRLHFAAGTVTMQPVCAMQTDGNTVRYTIAGKTVPEKDYTAYTEQLQQKKQPVWLAFDAKTVQKVFAQF